MREVVGRDFRDHAIVEPCLPAPDLPGEIHVHPSCPESGEVVSAPRVIERAEREPICGEVVQEVPRSLPLAAEIHQHPLDPFRRRAIAGAGGPLDPSGARGELEVVGRASPPAVDH
jgi:hypothetical protein